MSQNILCTKQVMSQYETRMCRYKEVWVDTNPNVSTHIMLFLTSRGKKWVWVDTKRACVDTKQKWVDTNPYVSTHTMLFLTSRSKEWYVLIHKCMRQHIRVFVSMHKCMCQYINFLKTIFIFYLSLHSCILFIHSIWL